MAVDGDAIRSGEAGTTNYPDWPDADYEDPRTRQANRPKRFMSSCLESNVLGDGIDDLHQAKRLEIEEILLTVSID